MCSVDEAEFRGAGLLQLTIDIHALSHNPSVLPVHAWEMRKSLAVLAEVGSVFQAAESDALSDDMSCTKNAKKHAAKVQCFRTFNVLFWCLCVPRVRVTRVL